MFKASSSPTSSASPSCLASSGARAHGQLQLHNLAASNVDPLRTDSPALLRQAPNSWNISPTFDTKHFSMRVGMTFDDKMIYAYQYEDLAYATDSNGNPILLPNGNQATVPNPQVGGTWPRRRQLPLRALPVRYPGQLQPALGIPGVCLRFQPEQRSLRLLQWQSPIRGAARVLPPNLRWWH